MSELFAAAAGFYRAAPWRALTNVQLLDVITPGGRSWTVCVLGNGGQEFGVALYEHRVFVEGTLFDINSFDQWGVELGKELATQLLPVVEGKESAGNRDASTAGLVGHIRQLRGAE